MNRRTILAGLIAGTFMGTVPVLAQETFPSKPITIIVPSAAGGNLDLASRRISEKMSEYLGQPFVVENRPGTNTLVGTKTVVDATPDGHTLVAQASTLNMLRHTMKGLNFDPQNDLVPIGVMVQQTNVFSTGGQQPYTSLTELVEDARQQPGILTFAHSGAGSPQHFTVEMMLAATGAEMQGIQYQGSGASFVDVVAGRVTLVSSGYQGQASFFPEGQLRPLAVSSATRIDALPDVPTLTELGIDVVSQPWLGLLAPKDVPAERIQRLSEALKAALEDPQLREQIISEGSDPTFLTPEEFSQLLATEAASFDELAERIGLEPQ